MFLQIFSKHLVLIHKHLNVDIDNEACSPVDDVCEVIKS